MKVGAIVLATDQGLGYLSKAFYDNGLIQYVYIHKHSSRKTHTEWYPKNIQVKNIDELIEKSDTVLLFEEAFDWSVIPKARQLGKKTVLMPMYECTRNPLPYVPDLILNPSALDQKYYPNGTQVTVPVSVPWKRREYARVFVHNAGNGGLGGRNGTRELLDAMRHVQSPIKLIIRSQVPIKVPNDKRIELRVGTFDDIWSEGDVFVFPEKFNGLSLPLQEAFASGMLVMCADRFPMNTWLPREPLIPVSGYKKERIAVEFDSAIITPESIAKTIDKWYNRNIGEYSVMGKRWAEQNSWRSLYKEYREYLCAK